MIDLERTKWELVDEKLSLYRYPIVPNYPTHSKSPILMLHGPMTNHRTWDTLATFLWVNGFSEIYAVDIESIQSAKRIRSDNIKALGVVVDRIFERYPPRTRMVIIGHSTGGVLGRRFLLKSAKVSKIAYLFTLASPHHRTHFSHGVYVPPELEDADRNSSSGRLRVVTPHITQNTCLVNFYGNAIGRDFDGTVRGVHLPEAVNAVFPLRHAEFKTHPSIQAEIMAFLQGTRYRVQFHLQELLMRTLDRDDPVGSFRFEINGIRSPYDGVFLADADFEYSFHENNTPLATLAYPNDTASVSIVFRLKDLARTQHIRRRLFAKLLVSLTDNVTAIHQMQDNEGSNITIRVHTQQVPKIVDSAG